MKIINQSVEIIDSLDSDRILSKLEKCGRVCYKSENLISEESKERFLRSIIDRGHESVLEHESITIKVITNRSVSHQLVRHRIASYSQESQRYCNYSKDKFNDEITVIKHPKFKEGTEEYDIWRVACEDSEYQYFKLLRLGASPEDAREVLTNSTKTEIIMTMNIRSWRNFFKTRLDVAAQLQIRELSKLILKEFKENIDVLFDDIGGFENE